MTKYTQKQLREMVSDGIAVDVTRASDHTVIPEQYRKVGYAEGVYGCSGMLMVGITTGRLYAVTTRSSAVYIF